MGTGLTDLPNQATVTYNGISFGSHSNVKAKSEFVYDEADRTVKGHKHVITVSAIVTPDDSESSLDVTLQDMRTALAEVGQRLTVESTGFGNLYINQTNGQKDIAFGPKPRILEWSPVGNNQAAEVVWMVETVVSPCPETADTGLMTFNYEVSHSINDRGFTTRTISGSIEIAMTREGRNIPDSADNYRHLIRPTNIPNFKRESQNYALSSDKKTLTFSIVDREIESPNAWPAGVVGMEARHAIDWKRRGRSRTMVPNIITANITLAANQPRTRAWVIFRSIFQTRLARVLNGAPDQFAIVESLTADEDLFGPTITFSIGYRVRVMDPVKLFENTSMFTPLGGAWETWKTSMAVPESDRGYANRTAPATDDKIIDLCYTTPATVPVNYVNPYPPVQPFLVFCNQAPDPRYSWIRFDASITDETETNTYVVKTLGSATVTPNTFFSNDPNATIETISTDTEYVDVQGVPGQRFRWKGVAERYGYRIPKPHLRVIGANGETVEVKLIGKPLFVHKLVGVYYCIPVYTAAWNFEYEVVSRPSKQSGSEPAEQTLAE